jgi:hypothetical protein
MLSHRHMRIHTYARTHTVHACPYTHANTHTTSIPTVPFVQMLKPPSFAPRRTGKNMIMASSDVSARGMDYPDVSFVLQVGTTTRDQYIHRLGRTARAGKSGAGLLMLAPFEHKFMTRDELKDLPLQTKTNVLSAEPTPLVRHRRLLCSLSPVVCPQSPVACHLSPALLITSVYLCMCVSITTHGVLLRVASASNHPHAA